MYEYLATATVAVSVAAGSPPAVSILSDVQGKCDPGERLILRSSVQPTDTASENIALQWLLTLRVADGSFGASELATGTFQSTNLATTTGLQSNNLVVRAGELQPGRTYRFTLQVTYAHV